MILVDTSAWIDFFGGKEPLAAAVDGLLAENALALCGPIVVELRRGLRSHAERRRVLPLLEGCHMLTDPGRLWEEAGELGYALGRKGVSAKTLDLLIATYALAHHVPILTTDRDFTVMKRAGVPIEIASC